MYLFYVFTYSFMSRLHPWSNYRRVLSGGHGDTVDSFDHSSAYSDTVHQMGAMGLSDGGGLGGARPPPTVRQARVCCAGGREVTVTTNIGAPTPIPGHDWSRPWQPATTSGRTDGGAGSSRPRPQPGGSTRPSPGGVRGRGGPNASGRGKLLR